MDPMLAGMIAFTVLGVAFYIAVWVWTRRESRKDEPPGR